MGNTNSLSSSLEAFSDSLIAPNDFVLGGKAAVDYVINLISRNRSDYDRFCIYGSMGKRTEIYNPKLGLKKPDFDVVVFLNCPEKQVEEDVKEGRPPFREILGEFYNLFAKDKNIKILNAAPTTFMAIEVRGYKIDLSPAINLTPGFLSSFFGAPTSHTTNTLKLMEKLPRPRNQIHLLNAGLAEASIAPFQSLSRPQLTHHLIRLAKFWNSKIPMYRHYVAGRSYLIECIAIKVVKEHRGNFSLESLLVEFLRFMLQFGSKYEEFFDPVNPLNDLMPDDTAIEDFDDRAFLCMCKYDNKKPSIDSIDQLVALLDGSRDLGQYVQRSDAVRARPPTEEWIANHPTAAMAIGGVAALAFILTR